MWLRLTLFPTELCFLHLIGRSLWSQSSCPLVWFGVCSRHQPNNPPLALSVRTFTNLFNILVLLHTISPSILSWNHGKSSYFRAEQTHSGEERSILRADQTEPEHLRVETSSGTLYTRFPQLTAKSKCPKLQEYTKNVIEQALSCFTEFLTSEALTIYSINIPSQKSIEAFSKHVTRDSAVTALNSTLIKPDNTLWVGVFFDLKCYGL